MTLTDLISNLGTSNLGAFTLGYIVGYIVATLIMLLVR